MIALALGFAVPAGPWHRWIKGDFRHCWEKREMGREWTVVVVSEMSGSCRWGGSWSSRERKSADASGKVERRVNKKWTSHHGMASLSTTGNRSHLFQRIFILRLYYPFKFLMSRHAHWIVRQNTRSSFILFSLSFSFVRSWWSFTLLTFSSSQDTAPKHCLALSSCNMSMAQLQIPDILKRILQSGEARPGTENSRVSWTDIVCELKVTELTLTWTSRAQDELKYSDISRRLTPPFTIFRLGENNTRNLDTTRTTRVASVSFAISFGKAGQIQTLSISSGRTLCKVAPWVVTFVSVSSPTLPRPRPICLPLPSVES